MPASRSEYCSGDNYKMGNGRRRAPISHMLPAYSKARISASGNGLLKRYPWMTVQPQAAR